jgi:anti-sigma factor RsiW
LREHLSQLDIRRYNLRELSPTELLTVDDHLATCAACRDQVCDPESAQVAFRFLRGSLEEDAQTHIPYEQLAAYVDNLADDVDREIVQSHLELCSDCAIEVEDLRTFRAEIQSLPLEGKANGRRKNFRESLAGFWQLPVYRFVLQAAGTVVIVLLVAWLWSLRLRSHISELEAQVRDLQQTNDSIQQQQNSTIAELREQVTQLQQSQQQLLTSPGEIAQAIYDGGGLVTVDRQGNLTGLTLSQELQRSLRAVMTGGRIEIPDLKTLFGKRSTLLGSAGEGLPFALVGPLGVVETDRPIFRWRSLVGATSYTVQVHDANFNKVDGSISQLETEWRASRPLARGKIYTWQVVAMKDGKEFVSPVAPAPEAKFKVLEQRLADEFAQARRDHGNSHLVLGTLYAQAGLIDEAEAEFKALASVNPRSEVVQKLLKTVRAARPAK